MGIRRKIAAALIFLPGLACAGDPSSRLERIATLFAEKENLSGQVLVAQHGKVLLDKSYKATADKAYPIGCITFQFTAAAILLLQEDGKLKLDDPVTVSLPEAPPGWNRITLRQLLQHRAGLGSFDDFPKDPDLRQAFEAFPTPEPDRLSISSPWGYFVLGQVIEKAGGLSYGDFLAKRIFGPLGMKTSAVSSPLFSAAGIVSTAEDLYRWEQALYGGKLLSPASLHQMLTPPTGEFHAMGVAVKGGYGHPYYVHDGVLIPGGGGFLVYRPEDQAVIAVLGGPDEGTSYDLVHLLADAALGEPALTRWEQGSTAQPNVLVPVDRLTMPGLNRDRTIRIYVPPGYSDHPERRYPVLYIQDGQDLFDVQTAGSAEWQVDETLNALAKRDHLEAIVVGIDSGRRRMSEFNPYPGPPLKASEGADYMRFIVEVVKPYMDKTYRTLPDRANTGIMGASMGGLISHYALQAYPQIFSKYGLLSTSYWASPELVKRAAEQTIPPDTRIFLYVGGEENEPMQQDTRAMAATLMKHGEPGEVMLSVDPESGHTNISRQRIFPAAVTWMFAK